MNTDMKAVWDRHAPEVGSQIAAILTIRNLWMSNCGILANLRETSKENATPKNGILDLMTQFANYKCSEPKDRIYALYSMASDLHPSGLNQGSSGIIMTVDYSLGLQETYRNFALSAIDAGHLTDILHSAAGRTIPEHLGWPSWLPDWRLSPTVSPKLKRTKNPAFVDGLKGVKFVGIEGNILHFIMNVLKEPDADSGTAHIFYPITAKGPAYIRTSLRGEDTEGNYIAAVDGFYNNKYRFRTLMESKVEPWYYNIKTTEPIVKWSQIIKEQFPSLMKGRCAFIASHHLHLNGDLFGIGSAELQIGDVIVVDGAHESSVDSIRVIRAALILRDCKEQSGGRKCWRLVGDATIMREPKGSPWFEARSRGIVKISLV
jgi:hypothetical protein